MGLGAPHPYTFYLPQYLVGGSGWTITNKAVAGQTCATILSNYSANIAPLFNAKDFKNVVSLECGINDLEAGSTPAQIYTSMSSYIAAAHATGFKVILWTVTATPRISETDRQTLNTSIIGNAAGADGIANYNSTPIGLPGSYTNTFYFQSDQTHPTDNGIAGVEAPTAAATVNAIP